MTTAIREFPALTDIKDAHKYFYGKANEQKRGGE